MRQFHISGSRLTSVRSLYFGALMLLCGCALSQAVGVPTDTSGKGVDDPPSGASSATDVSRLEQLWIHRSQDKFSPKFELGPGDILQVSVPDVPELQQRLVRVSAEDSIALPVAGVIPVQGMTEQDARKALRQRLQQYVKDPDVDVFVKEYHSRQVAVIGMVQRPGFYTLISRSDTLLDMVGQAGGMNANAAANIIFIPASSSLSKAGDPGGRLLPAESSQPGSEVQPNLTVASGREASALAEKSEKAAAVAPTRGAAANSLVLQYALSTALKQTTPIIINLSDAQRQEYLGIPARPGDVIIVPAAGKVMVDGWVQNPGAYEITPGATALSSISAAGGALFSFSASVLRTDKDGRKVALTLDLSKAKAGQEPDIPVQAGDIVFVNRSVVGAIPYSLYEIFTKFGTGMYLPTP